MKNLSTVLIIISILFSCKPEKKEPKAISIAQKIANAHGFEQWKNVKKVAFTFKVDRDTIKGSGRSWIWFPKKDSVIMKAGEQVVKFNRNNLQGVPPNADRNFTNDKFWAFVPFQLVWDKTATISKPIQTKSPINKQLLNCITITYPKVGGYTPGDAYDIFYNDDYMIREWVFRKGNSTTPSLTNTFENYKDFNGIKIAIDHKKDNGKWNLNFTNVSISYE